MRIPLVHPNMPKLSEVQEYYQLAEKHGQYSNFGICNDIAVTKLQKVYPGSYPVLVNNGTTALQVALQATLPRGSRVALPTFTFIATLNAVVAAGMVPVLFDVNPETWQIDMKLLDEHIDKYDAAIVVSPFGYSVDFNKYDHYLKLLGKDVIYDFAPAWGHPISNKNPTTFSFHATKTLPIGEGGAVMFQDEVQAMDGKRLINFDSYNGNIRSEFGMNGKMDELHAATLCTQLDRNDELLNTYSSTLVSSIGYSTKKVEIPSKVSHDHLQLPVLDFLNDKDLHLVKTCLDGYGIANKRYYSPLLHEAFPYIEFLHSGVIKAPKTTLGIARPDVTTYKYIIDAIREGLSK